MSSSPKAWRMTRFLRVVGDARINSGKQDLADFIEWGNKETGLSKSMVYFQLFPAHQGIAPGATVSTYGDNRRVDTGDTEECRGRGKGFGETQTRTQVP